jgi:hypothetical protein
MMGRKNRCNIQPSTWTCPHCCFIHRPADLVRIDDERIRCKQCGQAFDTRADPANSRDSQKAFLILIAPRAKF